MNVNVPLKLNLLNNVKLVQFIYKKKILIGSLFKYFFNI